MDRYTINGKTPVNVRSADHAARVRDMGIYAVAYLIYCDQINAGNNGMDYNRVRAVVEFLVKKIEAVMRGQHKALLPLTGYIQLNINSSYQKEFEVVLGSINSLQAVNAIMRMLVGNQTGRPINIRRWPQRGDYSYLISSGCRPWRFLWWLGMG